MYAHSSSGPENKRMRREMSQRLELGAGKADASLSQQTQRSWRDPATKERRLHVTCRHFFLFSQSFEPDHACIMPVS